MAERKTEVGTKVDAYSRNGAALEPFGLFSEGKRLRAGWTTGTCAAAAALSALKLLLEGQIPEAVSVRTPAGPTLILTPEEGYLNPETGTAWAAVRKDAGDDPDVTDGILVKAAVRIEEMPGEKEAVPEIERSEKTAAEPERDLAVRAAEQPEIRIRGGEGVGVVTKPGLDQPVGEAAINRVPRRMIREALLEELKKWRITSEQENKAERGNAAERNFSERAPIITVTLSVPGGEKLAEKTFNPRLGIRGGISILGTEGIVRPMSRAALIDTIRADMRMHAYSGRPVLAVPGNYGLRFLAEHYGVPEADPVIMSNFVGETIDAARECGAAGLLLAGHLGKFMKLSGGIMNTHSREADCRMELLAAHAIRSGADAELAGRILDCVTTEEAAPLLLRAGLLKQVSESLLLAAEEKIRRRAGEALPVGLIFYTLDQGILAESRNAAELIRLACADPKNRVPNGTAPDSVQQVMSEANREGSEIQFSGRSDIG